MLSLNGIGEPSLVKAMLSKSVEFKTKGIWTRIEPGKYISVDVDTQIGLIDGRHIQLNETDYSVIGLN